MAMRTLASLASLASLLLVGVPLAAQASGDETGSETDQVAVVARETDCPDDETVCFSVEAEPSSLSQGDEVKLTLRNAEGNEGEHNAHVAINESADPDHQATSSQEAIASTTTVTPGETATTTFTVPDGESLYLWCDTGGHEAGGMWTTVAIQSGNGTEEETEENDTEGDRATRDGTEPRPLEPTEDGPQDGGKNGGQYTLGWPLFAAALVAAAVGLYVSRHGA